MKKQIILLCLVFMALNGTCQIIPPSQSYQNLEKYWFYRYRLVNDFMYIGEPGTATPPGAPGTSIPAQARIRYEDITLNLRALKWSDATIDLGHYISVLATEWKQLNDQGWDTYRTEYELDKAIGAFERLDNYAIQYCYNVMNHLTTAAWGSPIAIRKTNGAYRH